MGGWGVNNQLSALEYSFSYNFPAFLFYFLRCVCSNYKPCVITSDYMMFGGSDDYSQ